MGRYIYIWLWVVLLWSCTQRQIIPDRELVQIFRDAYMVNAYTSVRGVNLDSLNIYEPIFESYGYTIEDVQYTIGNFTKRKSARLGDIVEGAIAILEREGLYYTKEVAILDSVRAISQRSQRRSVFHRDVLLVESQDQTDDLLVNIDNITPGEYDVSFDYLIDSLDENIGAYRTIVWFNQDPVDGDSSQPRYQENTSYMQRGRVSTYTKKFTVERDYSSMSIELVNFMGKKKEPHLKLRDIDVLYTPPADVAERQIFESLVKLNIYTHDSSEPTTPSL